jgi:hypothetical protein
MDFFKRFLIRKILDLDHNRVAEMSIFFGQNSESRLYHIIKVSQRRCHEVTETRFSCAHGGGKDKFRHNMLVHSVGRHTGHIHLVP